ncbi:MAG: hypothetical protein MJ032_02595, partial [Acidaminococcaceae bacterium]|nr:hypothetical protein [Acidaminococcaceae bacterium]
QAEREAMLLQSEIVKQAEEIAHELKENAEVVATQNRAETDAYCSQTRTDVLKYADDVLGYLADTLQSATSSILENRNHIAEEIAKQNSGSDVGQNRE